MKILYFANVRIPTEKAHGLQIVKMAAAFQAVGAAVELVVPRKVNKKMAGVDPYAFYRVKRDFVITKIKSLDPTWLMAWPQGFYIKVQSVFFIISLFFYLLFKKDKAGYIFYTREEYLLPLLLLFARRVVWEAHGLPSHSRFYLKFWRRCFKAVAISHGLTEDLAGLGISQGRIITAPDGVDLGDFDLGINQSAARAKIDLPENRKIILYAGQLYAWKGVATLATVARLLPDHLFVFVGGVGPELEKFREQNKDQNNTLFLGQKPYSDIPFYLKAADILVLPNSQESERSRRWTSPLKLFEYLTSGTPIVAVNLPSLTEILNGENAFLCQPDDPADMARAIQKALTDHTRSTRISAKAYADVQAYTWQKRAQKIVDFIQS